MLKTRILSVVILVILANVAVLGTATFVLKGNADDLYSHSAQEGNRNLLNKIIANTVDKLELNATSMTRNSDALAALEANDTEALNGASIGSFNRLSSGGIIDAMQIFDARGGHLVSHGMDGQPGGARSALAATVVKSTKPTNGLERNARGEPLVSYAFPLFLRGELAAVCVFTKGFVAIMAEVAKANGASTAILTPDNKVQDATDKPLFSTLSGLLNGAEGFTKVKQGGAYYSVSVIPLLDNDSKPLAFFVAAKDNTPAYAKDAKATWVAVAVSVAVFLSCIGFLWRYINAAFSPLNQMVEVMRRVERDSDFTPRAQIHNAKDEVGSASTAFNSLLTSIAAIIQEMQRSCDAMKDASRATAEAGLKVTQGTSSQSEAASEVAAAVEETSVSLSETASNAKAANEIADQAQVGIEKALTAMRETVANVDGVAALIRNASDNVGEL